MDLQHNIVVNTTKELVNQLENNLIEGLKRKGFVFHNQFELEEFVKSNCICKDNVELSEKTYFVNDIPFFWWKYKVDFNTTFSHTEMSTKLTASLGQFAFL